MNNCYYECRDDRKGCHFHPREVVVGVCALCLNERLLVLASKQDQLHTTNTNYSVPPKRVLRKIFALTSLLIKQQKSEVYHSGSTSQEDSFISIKFEDNGAASWDKGKINKMLDENQKMPAVGKKIKCVVEHMKPCTAQRWRRRIGHLLQLMRWNNKSSSSKCQMGTKLEGGKVKKYGWMRTLTRKKRAKA
ncbi:uncharacterized protein LOC127246608 [Andrographis paniculata]|uniref:uncharacterized protein LOC127246608 n=1 Tax=Andrographis paniculata TaxID=175694 RepID=UPI0021E9849F|nr:uncharacterized protein LOC127246608 [Andrographis paniculata]